MALAGGRGPGGARALSVEAAALASTHCLRRYRCLASEILAAVSNLGALLLQLESHRLRARLVHRGSVDDVLEVFRHVGVPVVTQLLYDLEAVEQGSVVAHTRLPLSYTDRIV